MRPKNNCWPNGLRWSTKRMRYCGVRCSWTFCKYIYPNAPHQSRLPICNSHIRTVSKRTIWSVNLQCWIVNCAPHCRWRIGANRRHNVNANVCCSTNWWPLWTSATSWCSTCTVRSKRKLHICVCVDFDVLYWISLCIISISLVQHRRRWRNRTWTGARWHYGQGQMCNTVKASKWWSILLLLWCFLSLSLSDG